MRIDKSTIMGALFVGTAIWTAGTLIPENRRHEQALQQEQTAYRKRLLGLDITHEDYFAYTDSASKIRPTHKANEYYKHVIDSLELKKKYEAPYIKVIDSLKNVIAQKNDSINILKAIKK